MNNLIQYINTRFVLWKNCYNSINKSSSKYLEENPAVQNDNSLVI